MHVAIVRARSCVAVSHTLPTSDDCHLHAAISHMTPLLACVAIRHAVPTSNARHPHVTIGCMVPSSSAHHPHIAIACVSPFASPSATWCPRVMPITHASPLPARHCLRHRRPHGAHKQCPSPARCHRHGCAAAVPNLKMLRVECRNMKGNNRRMFLYVPSEVLVS